MPERLQCCDKSGWEAYRILGYFIVGVGARAFIFDSICHFLFYFNFFLALVRSRYVCTEAPFKSIAPPPLVRKSWHFCKNGRITKYIGTYIYIINYTFFLENLKVGLIRNFTDFIIS